MQKLFLIYGLIALSSSDMMWAMDDGGTGIVHADVEQPSVADAYDEEKVDDNLLSISNAAMKPGRKKRKKNNDSSGQSSHEFDVFVNGQPVSKNEVRLTLRSRRKVDDLQQVTLSLVEWQQLVAEQTGDNQLKAQLNQSGKECEQALQERDEARGERDALQVKILSLQSWRAIYSNPKTYALPGALVTAWGAIKYGPQLLKRIKNASLGATLKQWLQCRRDKKTWWPACTWGRKSRLSRPKRLFFF